MTKTNYHNSGNGLEKLHRSRAVQKINENSITVDYINHDCDAGNFA